LIKTRRLILVACSRILPIFLCLSFVLAACSAAPTPGDDVAPPIVITVVVTPTGGGAPVPTSSNDTATSEPAATEDPSPTETPEPGHPAPVQNRVSAVYQDFEHGFMIYLDDRKVIWVFIPSAVQPGSPIPTTRYGLWLGYADTFVDGEPETLPTFQPPDTFQQPKRGFGKVWRDNAPIRDALGWALDFERSYTAVVIDYDIAEMYGDGSFGPTAHMHTITTINGDLTHINEATNLWSQP
jgi:hypothetical protein